MRNKRYFYTDPLAAAWMAKRCGMRFVSWHSRKEYDISVIEANCGSPLREIREDQRYVVHPDSLHLLEPREGDTVTAGGGKYHFLCGNSGVFGTPLQSLPQAVGPLGMKQLWIIQRNGIPFMWPESEAE